MEEEDFEDWHIYKDFMQKHLLKIASAFCFIVKMWRNPENKVSYKDCSRQ